MFKINFGESAVLEFDSPITVYEAAKSGNLVARSTLAVKIGDDVHALDYVVSGGCDAKLLTFDDPEGKHVFWHTASHILGQAVKRLYPEAKLTIGPAIENGFYYDIDSETSFTPEILGQLEAEMQKIVKENL